MEKQGYVYILANKPFGTLYIGVTSDLIRRVYEHKQKFIEGFTAHHGLDKLVYYEIFGDIAAAILREKQMKEWKRGWKLKRIVDFNPDWQDLYASICG